MQYSREEIFTKLKEILKTTNYVDEKIINECTEDYHIITDLGLSSIMILHVLVLIEESFNIKIDMNNGKNILIVKNIIDIIYDKTKKSE